MSFWKKLFGVSDQTSEDTSKDNLFIPANPRVDDHEIWEDEPDEVATEEDSHSGESSAQQKTIEPAVAEEAQGAAPSSTSETEPSDSTDTQPVVETGAENVSQPSGRLNKGFSNVFNSPSVSTETPQPAVNLDTIDEPRPEPVDEELLVQELEYQEDLSILDGRILPELVVPDWREELEFVKERYEPCDLTDHIVKVSKRRLTARQIDHELAQSRLNAYQRYLERASRRFKDRIDEDALLTEALVDLSQWKIDQAKSIAWRLAERVNEEVLKAKQAELEATTFIESNTEFSNAEAVNRYRQFARKALLIPLVTAYILSVVGLTYNQFEWLMKFLPFFNLGISNSLIMISGVASAFWFSNLWKYSKSVAKTQKQLAAFTIKQKEQHEKIKHAVKQHTRLAQQQPLVEPILKVLAKAYRVQLQSDVTVKAQVTTSFEAATLPACVAIARAVDTDEDKMARLKKRALSVLMSPGWRTKGLEEIARIHADSTMLDSNSLS